MFDDLSSLIYLIFLTKGSAQLFQKKNAKVKVKRFSLTDIEILDAIISFDLFD